MSGDSITIAPVRGAARIEVLDVLRGIAILLIFYMNIPFQAVSVSAQFADIRLIGWTPGDQATWFGVQVLLEGTQRCMLEFLFGAGVMILTRRAMVPDGPVAIADLYYRRNMWLMVFGLIDIFLVLWVGDILLIYGLAAMFLFPFRKLGPKLLVGLGLGFALFVAVGGAFDYAERVALIDRVAAVEAKQSAGQPLAASDSKTLADWKKIEERLVVSDKDKKNIAEETQAHSGGWLPYASYYWEQWMTFFVGKGFLFLTVIEAFFAMLIGIALFKWGIIQGERSGRFYAVLTLTAYAVGMTARTVGAMEITSFSPIPKSIWITSEFARLAMGLGHVALVNWVVKSGLGARILRPFAAAGQTAFSLYFLTQIIGLYILFAPWGFNLWGQFGWTGMFWIATAMIAGLLLVANLWAPRFTGPLEWVWRSLSYVTWQPFRKKTA